MKSRKQFVVNRHVLAHDTPKKILKVYVSVKAALQNVAKCHAPVKVTIQKFFSQKISVEEVDTKIVACRAAMQHAPQKNVK